TEVALQRAMAMIIDEQDLLITAHNVAILEKHAIAHLPAYAVPSYIVVLHELPTTPNGKVDRNALPAYSRVRRSRPVAAGYAPPETLVEQRLAILWADLLGVPDVGRDD